MLLISYVRGLLIGVPDRVRLNVADDKVFEAYRELIEQVASDAYDAGAKVDDAGCVLVTSEAIDRVSRSA